MKTVQLARNVQNVLVNGATGVGTSQSAPFNQAHVTTVPDDGVLQVQAIPTGTFSALTFTLQLSSDGGITWSQVGNIWDAVAEPVTQMQISGPAVDPTTGLPVEYRLSVTTFVGGTSIVIKGWIAPLGPQFQMNGPTSDVTAYQGGAWAVSITEGGNTAIVTAAGALKVDGSGVTLTTEDLATNIIGNPIVPDAIQIGYEDGSGNTQIPSVTNPLPVNILTEGLTTITAGSPPVVCLAVHDPASSGTQTVVQGTVPWTVAPDGTVWTLTGTSANVNITNTPAVTATDNITKWNSVALGSPSAQGTLQTVGNLISTNSQIFVGTTAVRTNQTTTAAGVVDVNIVGSLGSTMSATKPLFTEVTDGTNAMGAMANFGTNPTAVKALNTNASIFTGTTAVAAATFGTTNSGNGILANASVFVGTTAATAATFGTTASGTGLLTNASLFIGTAAARSNQTTTAAGVQDVNLVGALGVTMSKTNPIFANISDGTNSLTAALSAWGTAPTGTAVMGVNANIFGNPLAPIGVLLEGVGGSTPYPAPTIVQSAHNTNGNGNTSLVITPTFSQAQGSLLVVVWGVGDNNAPTFSDANGNVWTVSGSQVVGPSNVFRIGFAYTINKTGGVLNQVTMTHSGGVGANAATLYEVVGAQAFEDVHHNANGTGTALDSGAATTNLANEIVFAAFGVGTAAQSVTVTAGSAPGGWVGDSNFATSGTSNGIFQFAAAHVINSTASSTDAAATIGSSEPWAAIFLAFRPTSSPIVQDVADMLGTVPGTAPSYTGIVGGIYNSSPPSPSSGQTLPLQLTSAGALITSTSFASGAKIEIWDGTTVAGVIAGTTALKTDLSSVAGTATSTAASGVQLVGLADGAGNKLTTNSTTTTSKFALDSNLLSINGTSVGTLLTAASTAAVATQPSLAVQLSPSQPQLTAPLNTTLQPATSGGLTISFTNNLITTVTSVKSSAGQIYGWHIGNNTGAACYVQVFNVASGSVSLGSTAPTFVIFLPVGGATNVSYDIGVAFGTAISIAATTTATGSTTPGNGVAATFFYK